MPDKPNSTNKIDQVEKPAYSPNSSTPKDIQAGGMNISSLMNVFATMLAEGSGDPQVKMQVMENLARRRAAVEAEAANRQAFENEAQQLVYRQKLSVATEAQSETDVPSKEANARRAQVDARVAESTETGTVAAQNAENKLKTVMAKDQVDDPEYRKAILEKPKVDLEVSKLEKNIAQIKLQNATDPQLKNLELQLQQLKVEQARYEVLKTRGEALKTGGGIGGINAGLNASQHLKSIQGDMFGKDEAGKLPPDMQMRIAYGRDIADQAPPWLQNMRYVGKYAQSSIDPITQTIDPTKGEIAYADMIRVVVPVIQKISSGTPISQGDALVLGGAIEDAWMQDHMFFDNIVDEIARSMQMIDPDVFGAYTEVEPGSLAADDSTAVADEISPEQAQRQVARQAAIKLLASYGITEALMEQHKQTRLDAQARKMLQEDVAKEKLAKEKAASIKPRQQSSPWQGAIGGP